MHCLWELVTGSLLSSNLLIHWSLTQWVSSFIAAANAILSKIVFLEFLHWHYVLTVVWLSEWASESHCLGILGLNCLLSQLFPLFPKSKIIVNPWLIMLDCICFTYNRQGWVLAGRGAGGAGGQRPLAKSAPSAQSPPAPRALPVSHNPLLTSLTYFAQGWTKDRARKLENQVLGQRTSGRAVSSACLRAYARCAGAQSLNAARDDNLLFNEWCSAVVIVCICKMSCIMSTHTYASGALCRHSMLTLFIITYTSSVYSHKLLPLPFDWNKHTLCDWLLNSSRCKPVVISKQMCLWADQLLPQDKAEITWARASIPTYASSWWKSLTYILQLLNLSSPRNITISHLEEIHERTTAQQALCLFTRIPCLQQYLISMTQLKWALA